VDEQLLQLAGPSHYVPFVSHVHAATHDSRSLLGRPCSPQQHHGPLVHVESTSKCCALPLGLHRQLTVDPVIAGVVPALAPRGAGEKLLPAEVVRVRLVEDALKPLLHESPLDLPTLWACCQTRNPQ
jgi:hypothetical protein